MSAPQIRSRVHSVEGLEQTTHYLFFADLEETTFVFDGHPPHDLEQLVAVIGKFMTSGG